MIIQSYRVVYKEPIYQNLARRRDGHSFLMNLGPLTTLLLLPSVKFGESPWRNLQRDEENAAPLSTDINAYLFPEKKYAESAVGCGKIASIVLNPSLPKAGHWEINRVRMSFPEPGRAMDKSCDLNF